MIQRNTLSAALAVVLAGSAASVALADDRSSFAANLTGYQETPLTLNSPASGEFAAKVSNDGTAIHYTLTYRGFTSDVTQAHIHFGRPALTGMIVLFLCNNTGTPPASVPKPPACPVRGGTVTGTLTAADMIERAPQNVHGGTQGFAEIVEALRNGAAYANVHTANFGSGEIRAALGHAHDQGPGEHDDD
jgi:hypothetical protein